MSELTADELSAAIVFTATIIPILHRWEGSVCSGGRGATHNAEVGGAWNSRHLCYCAADVEFEETAKRDFAYDECYAAGLHGYKVGNFSFHMQDRPGTPPA